MGADAVWNVLAAGGGTLALVLIVTIAVGINALTLLFLGSAVVTLERFARLFGAVDARRAEEHHRVLDVFGLEPAQRLQILGEDAKRARFFALEKLFVPVSKRLGMHLVILSTLGDWTLDAGL